MRLSTTPSRTAVHRVAGGAASWSRPLACAGFAARAAVYLVLAALTVDIAVTGGAPAPTDSTGAFAEVARQPAGPVLLGILASGLLAYALWRLVVAICPGAASERGARHRAGEVLIALVYVGLFAEAVAALVHHQSSGGPSAHPRPYVALVLGWPGGPVWVGLAGVGVVVAGIALCAWGAAHDASEDLSGVRRRRTRSLARWCGVLGNLTRGALAALVGAYLITAAVTDRPGTVKGLDAALLTAARTGAGPVLLGAAAAGLGAFAVLSLLEARYRRL